MNPACGGQWTGGDVAAAGVRCEDSVAEQDLRSFSVAVQRTAAHTASISTTMKATSNPIASRCHDRVSVCKISSRCWNS